MLHLELLTLPIFAKNVCRIDVTQNLPIHGYERTYIGFGIFWPSHIEWILQTKILLDLSFCIVSKARIFLTKKKEKKKLIVRIDEKWYAWSQLLRCTLYAHQVA